MHTDAERKYAAIAVRARRASREDKSSLLDCAAPWFRIFLCMFGLIVVMAIGCGYALQL